MALVIVALVAVFVVVVAVSALPTAWRERQAHRQVEPLAQQLIAAAGRLDVVAAQALSCIDLGIDVTARHEWDDLLVAPLQGPIRDVRTNLSPVGTTGARQVVTVRGTIEQGGWRQAVVLSFLQRADGSWCATLVGSQYTSD